MSFYHSKKMTLSCNYYLEPCEIIIVIFFLMERAQLIIVDFGSDPRADIINLLRLLKHEMRSGFSQCFVLQNL